MVKWFLTIILIFTGCQSRIVKRKSGGSRKANPLEKLLGEKKPFEFVGTITWKYGTKPQVLVENITLRRDENGSMHGIRNLSSEDGYEFIVFPDDRICVRLRYEKYVCRSESENEGQIRSLEILRTPQEFIAPFVDNLKILTSEKEKAENLFDSELKKKVFSIAPKKNPIKTIDGKFRGKLIFFTGEKLSSSGGLDNSGDFAWGAEFIDESGSTVKVYGQLEFTLKKFKGKISKPDENMVSKNWKRVRPLADRKKLLGNTVPRQLKHLYR
ncbi:hypothetical protein KKF34_10550 [Myxococcota bacterium]|nr:hypothetical protein [Myxococcota bacterium]MBU1380535.1 hypothetical protein [Myxococcota bacterium]MBU1497306.1 hypothetical protein [Myxococcota bacterium]